MNDCGETFQFNNKRVFFGNRHSSLEGLKQRFPLYEFFSLTQVHGNSIVEADDPNIQADAHWTHRLRQSLCIQTADCLPVFIGSRTENLVAAIHAGWRGIVKDIIRRTFDLVFKKESPEIFAHIGPHIQWENFEVSSDVACKLKQSYMTAGGSRIDKIENIKVPGKSLINLSEIICQQLKACGLDKKKIYVSNTNTFTNKNFESFRRGKKKANRQLSFIVIG